MTKTYQLYTMGQLEPSAIIKTETAFERYYNRYHNGKSSLEDLLKLFFYSFPTDQKPPVTWKFDHKDDERNPVGVIVQMAVAGCREEDIKVWLEDKAIIVEGSNEGRGVSDKFKLDFKRTFAVSKELNPTKATAKVEDGILTINIPMADQAENRTYILGGKT